MRNDTRTRHNTRTRTRRNRPAAAVAIAHGFAAVPAACGALVALVVLVALGTPADARAQMPDLSQMSGRSLPSPDLPTGTVSVRVIRGAITNNVTGAEVRLEGGAHALTVATDGSGRAMFPNVTPGSTWRAVVTVDGERLESQPFVVPSSGGLRVILAAGVAGGKGSAGTAGNAGGAGNAGSAGNAGAAAQAPVPGELLLGSQSRLVIELAEGSLEVYGLFNLGNTHATPIITPQPIVFQTPDNARNTSVLEGSTPQAKADGNKVTVTGPFAPGETPLQIAYRIPYEGDTVTIAQTLPLTMRQATVIVRKLGNVRVEMPGVRGQREAQFEGRTYIVVNADRVDANGQLNVRLRGLPHRPYWPRYTALGLAALMALVGLWLAIQPDRGALDDTDARTLRTRRLGLFEQLVAVERRLLDRRVLNTRQGDDQDEDGLLALREALVAEIEDLDDVLASLASTAARSGAAGATGARTPRSRSRQVAADASKAAAAAGSETGVGSTDSRDVRADSPGDAADPRVEPRPAVR
jgi:hypothetical protein